MQNTCYSLFLCFLLFLQVSSKKTLSCSCVESGKEAGPSYQNYQYSAEAEVWFKLHRVPATWNTAHTNCLKEGAQLASPINRKFLKEMKNIMEKNHVYCGVFTGINSKSTPGHYSSIEGIPLGNIFVPWEEKQQCPETFGEWIVLRQQGRLDSVGQDDAYPYICYKKNKNDTKFDDGYTKDNRTGSYYKFHREGKTWPEAAMACISEDAHLAIINSATESNVLKEIFTKHPPETLGSSFKNSALIGMLDWGAPRGWLTINGQSLQDAGFATWSPSQPDHSAHPNGNKLGLFCGAIFRSALLDDIWCDVNFAFICERTPFETNDNDNDCDDTNFGEGVINERTSCDCQ